MLLTLFLGWSFQERSRELLREELAKEGRAISRVVQVAAEDYLRDRQVRDLRELADRISGYERVLGVRLFDRDGVLTYQPKALDPYPFEHWSELKRVLAAHKPVELRRHVGDQPAVGFLVPLFNRRGQLLGAVQVLQLESYIAEDERATRAFVLSLTLATAVATIAIALIVTQVNIARPVDRLVRRFQEVGASEVPTRVPVRGEDEFARLSREFNGMCERLEQAHERIVREQAQRRDVEEQLRQAERLAGLGRLSAGLAHEIGTPLNVILGRAESLQRSLPDGDPGARHLGIIVSQSERIARIVRDMLDFARMKPRRHVELAPAAIVRTTVELIERRADEQHVTVRVHEESDAPVLGDPDQLQQVFLNLASNALDAMPDGGRLDVTVRVETAAPHDAPGASRRCVTVAMRDTGCGLEPEALSRVFDPFYTTKEAGRGTGLGLSVAYGIIEEHGGWFDVESTPGQGATFHVRLPACDAASAGGQS
ncbi:MAG: ATP-binding protein [Candidatus Eisenbacteria bacterium]